MEKLATPITSQQFQKHKLWFISLIVSFLLHLFRQSIGCVTLGHLSWSFLTLSLGVVQAVSNVICLGLTDSICIRIKINRKLNCSQIKTEQREFSPSSCKKWTIPANIWHRNLQPPTVNYGPGLLPAPFHLFHPIIIPRQQTEVCIMWKILWEQTKWISLSPLSFHLSLTSDLFSKVKCRS